MECEGAVGVEDLTQKTYIVVGFYFRNVLCLYSIGIILYIE